MLLDRICNKALRVEQTAAARAAQRETRIAQKTQPFVGSEGVATIGRNVESQPAIAAERSRKAVTYLGFESAEPAELGGKIGRPVLDVDLAIFERPPEPVRYSPVAGIDVAGETGTDL